MAMFPIALIVVVAIVALCLVVAGVVLAYKLHPSNRPQLPPGQRAIDVEQSAPLRRVRVRHGRVVSASSTIKPSSQSLMQWASNMTSRRSSCTSLPTAENIDAAAVGAGRQILPPLPHGPDGKLIGIGIENMSTQAISAPKPAYLPHRRSHEDQAGPQTPLPREVKACTPCHQNRPSAESSPAQVGDRPQRMDKALYPAGNSSPSITRKSRSVELVRESPSRSIGHSRRPSAPVKVPTPYTEEARMNFAPVPLKKFAVPNSQLATPPMSGSRTWNQHSRNFSGPAATSQHKPAPLNFHAAQYRAGHDLPSPPPSSKLNPLPLTPVSPSSQAPPKHDHQPGRSCGDMVPTSPYHASADFESPSLRLARRLDRSPSPRTSSRSRNSKVSSLSHRVQKKPPPILTLNSRHDLTELVQTPTSTKDIESDSEPFIPSPAQSDASLASLKVLKSMYSRNSARQSTQTFASSDLSPTFSVAPVFRVPLHAGKRLNMPTVKVVGKRKETNRPSSTELASPGIKTSKPADADIFSVLNSQKTPELDGHTYWPPSDIPAMIAHAHGLAQSLDPVTPTLDLVSHTTIDQAQPHHRADHGLGLKESRPLRPILAQSYSSPANKQVPRDRSIDRPDKSSLSQATTKSGQKSRPSLDESRSLSGNIRPSAAQIRAQSQLSPSSPSIQQQRTVNWNQQRGSAFPGGRPRSRYSHIADTKKLPALPSPEGGLQLRKGSLPARLPGFTAPPDPEVLSRILGLEGSHPSTGSESYVTSSPLGIRTSASQGQLRNEPSRSVIKSMPVDASKDLRLRGLQSALRTHDVGGSETSGEKIRHSASVRMPPAGGKNGRGVGFDAAPTSRRDSPSERIPSVRMEQQKRYGG